MSIEFATAAAFQQSEPSRRLTRVYAPAITVQPVIRCDARTGDFTDYVELAFGGLVIVAAMLFTAALLRFCWINGQVAGAGLHVAARIVDAAAGATGGAVIFGFAHGIHSLGRS